MNEDQIRSIVKDELNNSQYTIGGIPFHTHNGIDSPKISTSLTTGVSSATASAGISISPTTGDIVVTNTGVRAVIGGTGITIANPIPNEYEIIGSQWKGGWNSRLLTSLNGTQTIAHGLGVFPKFITINGSYSAGTALMGVSNGNYNGTITNCTFTTLFSNSGVDGGGTSLNVIVASYSGSTQQASISWDATNFYLNWVIAGGGIAATMYFMWQAYG